MFQLQFHKLGNPSCAKEAPSGCSSRKPIVKAKFNKTNAIVCEIALSSKRIGQRLIKCLI